MRCSDTVFGAPGAAPRQQDVDSARHDLDGAPPRRTGNSVEAKQERLQNERRACEANLERLDADLHRLAIEHDRLQDVVEPDPLARLRVLACMTEDLRTALHGILGYVQLFRLRGGVDTVQTAWVDSMLAAGTRLLGQVHCVVNLTDMQAEPAAWMVNEDNPAADMRMGPPIARSAAPGDPPDGSPERDRQSGLHVLVVDDDVMNRDIATAFIRDAGHCVVAAETGQQAVSAAATTDFDVILMDLRMPGLNGMDATRLIRALPGAHGRVPIIALTAQAFADKVEACREAGMNGHLAKPFRYDTLNQAVLEAAIEGKALRPPGQAADRQCQPAEPKTRAFISLAARQPPGPGPAWIDIASPWNSVAGERSDQSTPASAYILDTQFRMKLTAIDCHHGRQLVAGSVRSCVPSRDGHQHEFHWLLYTDPAPAQGHVFTSTCDLWRWKNTTWQSIAVPGAHFSPDEMYEQGWRYCGPCVEKSAIVEVS
jgi:CheY-like chemotaxis protein